MKKNNLLLLLLFMMYWQAQASIVILNGLSHIHETTHSSVISGKIVVQNNSKTEAKVLLYQEDLVLECGKPSDYLVSNSQPRSSGNWTKIKIEEKLLQPNEIYEIGYTTTVPSDANGSYWTIIMVEGATPIKEETSGNIKIDSKVRYGVQVITNVGVPDLVKIAFEKTEINKQVNNFYLSVLLKNNSIFLSKIKLTVEIYNKDGQKIKVIESLQKKIFPEKCQVFELNLSGIPVGKYESVLIADNGKDLYGANLSIDIQ